jgi:putative restriction endonuclease
MERDPTVGCIILTQPIFFDRPFWIPTPSSFSPNTVQGKGYNSLELDGAEIWYQVQESVRHSGVSPDEHPLFTNKWPLAVQEASPAYGISRESRHRLGQGAFRVMVTDAYQRRCAITGERTLPVLEAAHIKRFGEGPNAVTNGILLRSDIHALFDRGLLTVTPELHVEVSTRIKEDYGNGRAYYEMHGRKLSVLPEKTTNHPQRDYLEWHNNNIFIP